MADTEDIQPLVCDNGTGMVKVIKKRGLCILHMGSRVLNYLPNSKGLL